METQLKPKAKSVAVSRIVLSEEASKYLCTWMSQLRTTCPGIRLKKHDLLSWLVSQKGNKLSSSDLKIIKERFHDEIELAEWVLKQLKAAKARNEKLSLAELLGGGPQEKVIRSKRAVKQFTPPLAAISGSGGESERGV
jgi:hypothetical protein